MQSTKNQLFVIPGETWDALDKEEVMATVSAMKEMDIYKLPYPKVDVWLGANGTFGWQYARIAAYSGVDLEEEQRLGLFVLSDDGKFYKPAKGSGFVFEIRNLSLSEDATVELAMHATPGTLSARHYRCCSTDPVAQTNIEARDAIASVLITLLATRNAIKSTKENKCAKLGIGGKKPGRAYRYVTTITLPHELEPADGEPSTPGKAKRPHLRRGHIRSQHYGPRNALVKKKWIEPVFVNADKDWVDGRERYNVSL